MAVGNEWLLAVSLLAIAVIGGSYVLYRRKISLSSVLRFLAATCILASFGGIRLELEHDLPLAVYVLDVSGSYTPYRLNALEALRTHASGISRPSRAALVTFGSAAALDGPVDSDSFTVPVDAGAGLGRDSTSIEAALKAACAARGQTDRVYLFSDGRSNTGNAAKGALLCSQEGMKVLPVVLNAPVPVDAWVSRLEAPVTAVPGEPVKIYVHAGTNRSGQLNVSLVAGARRFIRKVELAGAGGVQRVEFEVVLNESGTVPLLGEVSATGFNDSYPGNNAARSAIRMLGPLKLLVFSGNKDSAALRLLQDWKRFPAVRAQTGDLPETPGRLQDAAVVVLDNMPAHGFTDRQMDALKRYVRDLGGGLLVLGGPDSYGPGGYIETALEEALPVWCNPEKRRKASLVFVLDASGSMAQETDFMGEGHITKFRAALKAIVPVYREIRKGDRVGIITFNTQPMTELPLTGDDDGSILKVSLTGELTAKRPGGKTNIYPALLQAAAMLEAENRENGDDRTCHMVLLSDGVQTVEGSIDLDLFKKAGISVSTVATGATPDRERLREIADKTGGHYYETAKFDSTLRKIFEKDVRRNLSELTRTGEIKIEVAGQAEFTKGVQKFPGIRGMVLTSAKDQASIIAQTDEKEPVLAWWRLGLGRVIAFTGGLDVTWGAEWLGWEGLPGLIRQAVSWLHQDRYNPGFALSTSVSDLTVRAKLVARSGGKLQDDLSLKAVFSSGDGFRTQSQLIQSGPGEYAAEAQGQPDSLCIITVFRETGEMLATAESWIPGTLEYGAPGPDTEALSSLAALTGGEVLSEDKFLADMPEGRGGRGYDLWWILLIFAGCFFLADMAQNSLLTSRKLK